MGVSLAATHYLRGLLELVAVNNNLVAREEQWRVFCAVDLPHQSRMRVMEHIARLRTSLPQVQASWSREANVHLTLKFLGESPKSSVPSFSLAVSRAVDALPPFSIMLEHTGVFPKRREPRVLWIGISDPGGRLAELHSRLEAETAQVGFPKEARPFHPHLTLARLRNPRYAREIIQAHEQLEFVPEEITVSELLVIRSELSGSGSKYTVISRHALGSPV